MTLRLDIMWKELPQFATGLGNTLWLCLLSMMLSLVLGTLLLGPLTSRTRAPPELSRSSCTPMMACGVTYGMTLSITLPLNCVESRATSRTSCSS